MTTQLTINNAAGLYAQPNSFSQVPDGGYEEALNVVIRNDGVLQKRRGFFEFNTDTITNACCLAQYADLLWLFNNSKLSKFDVNGALTDLTGSSPQTEVTPRYVQSNGNLYWTTDVGVKKIDSASAEIDLAGMPRGLDLELSLSGQTGIMAPDTAIAYRYLYGTFDANDNKLLGAPSQVESITNPNKEDVTASESGGTVTITDTAHGWVGSTVLIKVVNAVDSSGVDVTGVAGTYTATITDADTLTFTAAGAVTGTLAQLDYGVWKTPTATITVSSELDTADFYQVYRSEQTAGADITPDDELQLVTERSFSSAEISGGFVSFEDDVDDVFLGAFLYTNANTGGTILAANERPPKCEDVALFKGSVFYANTTSLAQFELNLISVVGMSNGDTVAISDGTTTRTYTAAASESGLSFKLATSGTVSQNIDETARSICRVINQDSSGLVYAFYVSRVDDVPGQIYLEARSYDTTSFTIVGSDADVGSSFQPDITSAESSVTFEYPNAIYWSKTDEPESVPSVNFTFIGSKNSAIQRIVPLRDTLLILKEDGFYRLTGDTPSQFQVQALDLTLGCIAPSSVAVLNNQCYTITRQGVVAVSDVAAAIVSRQIEPLLTTIISKDGFSTETQAVAYESERLYCLSTFGPQSDTVDTVYVLNIVTNSWTTWDTTFSDAVVKLDDDRMYYLSGDSVYKERKEQTKLDYCGQDYDVAINSVDEDTVVLTTNGTPTIDDVVVVDDLIYRISAVEAEGASWQVTFTRNVSFAALDTGSLYKAFTSRIRTVPITGGDVSRMKQFTECQAHFRSQPPGRLNIFFGNDYLNSSDVTRWTPADVAEGWGTQPWGLFAWGETETTELIFITRGAQPLRTYIPLAVAKGTWLSVILEHTTAADPLDMQAISLSARVWAQRVGR